MSIVNVNQIVDRKNKPLVNSSGNIVQVVYARTDNRVTYSTPLSGNGTTIIDLNISITPKVAGNLLLMQWMINHETIENAVFLIHRDGNLISTNPQGLNQTVANNRWVGYVPTVWDGDNDSTPNNTFITYSQYADSTDSRTYAPALRASGPTAGTMALNRVINNAGSDNFENMVSVGVIYEITV